MSAVKTELDVLRNTLKRIAREIVAVAPDSGECDSIGEIYHLLRECGAFQLPECSAGEEEG